MSKYQLMRDLVHERLTAAAEEIFALFERTIVEYEEELCRSKDESQRKQDQVLNPPVVLVHRVGAGDQFPTPSPPPGPGMSQTTETAQIKEESEDQSIKEEEEQLPLCLPESNAVHAKTEELPTILRSEPREEAPWEDINSGPPFHSQTEEHMEHSSDTDSDDDWEAPASCSVAQMETEADGDHHNQVQVTEESTVAPTLHSDVPPKSATETTATANNGNVSRTGAKRNHVCSLCQKRFRRKMELQRHVRVHTGEKPYSCTLCTKSFSQNIHLEVHMRTHSSDKPYSCPVCAKTFTQKIHLEVHLRTHTGKRPYRCSVCKETFTQKVYRQKHTSTHTESQAEQRE